VQSLGRAGPSEAVTLRQKLPSAPRTRTSSDPSTAAHARGARLLPGPLHRLLQRAPPRSHRRVAPPRRAPPLRLHAAAGACLLPRPLHLPARAQVVRLGLQIRSALAKLRLDANLYVAPSVISMYARCGRPDDACRVFEEMRHRDVVSWNAMISGYARAGLFDRAIGLFREFVAVRCSSPDGGTMAGVLPAMGNAKPEDIAFVRRVFDSMQCKELISWNAMLAIYANNAYHVEAVELFMEMEKDGVEPDSVTLATVLPPCGELSAFSLGKRIHEVIKRKKMRPNLLLESALMDMYSGCGCLKDARDIFDSMSTRNVISWTSMISAYGKHGHGREAVDLFEKMQGQGLEPDYIAFIAILSACSHAGLLDVGKRYFDCMTSRYHITPKAQHYTISS
jgi:pentatricopeptide repeat protein